MQRLIDVEDALAAILGAGGRVVVQGRIGEAGAPASPYVMWSMDAIDLPDFTVTDVDGVEQVIVATNTPLEFVLDWVGGAAMADAALFGLSLRQSQRLFDLWRLCGLSGIGRIQNLSALETGAFRQRVQTRLSLFTAVELTAPLELIETSVIQVREAAKELDETINVTAQGDCP